MPEGWLGGPQMHKTKKICKNHQKRIWTILKRFRSHMDSEKYCLPAILSLRGYFFLAGSLGAHPVQQCWPYGVILEGFWSGFGAVLWWFWPQGRRKFIRSRKLTIRRHYRGHTDPNFAPCIFLDFFPLKKHQNYVSFTKAWFFSKPLYLCGGGEGNEGDIFFFFFFLN